MSEPRQRRFWGWGYEESGLSASFLKQIEAGLAFALGLSDLQRRCPPTLDQLKLKPSRVSPPKGLQHLCHQTPFERASHAMGKSYRDLIRGIDGTFEHPPDVVAMPAEESEILELLDWAAAAQLAVIPYGGGTSVCGGVEPCVGQGFRGTLCLDLKRMNQLLELDPKSRLAKFRAGVLGPDLEAALRPSGLTLRHYPQSFEFSSLGGWVATRAGGHFATRYTHIDEQVAGLRLITPQGFWETRCLPGSGAGPDPNRLVLGSEGSLGVITEVWLRLFERPCFRARATVAFDDFTSGVECLRNLVQSGLTPANCRLLDPLEAMLNGSGSDALILLGFESAYHDQQPQLVQALEVCRQEGGRVVEQASESSKPSELAKTGAWREAFLRAPYLRDELILRGLFVETFETAVRWSLFSDLHDGVMAAAKQAAAEFSERVLVSCRITHAYPDGAAPYYTVICQAKKGVELPQWYTIKEAISDAILAGGGTCTHHHAVGRDVMPWYKAELPKGFRSALAAVKRQVDPEGLMNPGVLV